MKTFYEKIGKRYYPVKEYDEELISSLAEGSYLITIKPGSKNIRKASLETKEEFEILATLIKYEKELFHVLIEESKMRPNKEPLTKKQNQAWINLEKSFGGSVCTLQGKSWQEIIDKLHLSIIEKIKTDKRSILLLDEVIEN